MKNLQLLWRSISTIGLFGTLRFGLARLLRIDTPIVVEVRGQTDRIKVLLRPRESDLFVIDQVFGNKEYDIGARRANALNALAQQWRSAGVQPVIIDGGANVGYASFYFADLYRDAIVLAVEPNPATFEVLKKSVQGHSRIVPIHAALWSHDRGVDLVHGDSGSWSDRVSDGAASPSLVPSLRLDQILAHVPSAAALIVKLDIEGSEREVCEASMPLLREAPCIVIEPHDWMLPGAGSLVPLFKALSDRQMDSLLIGENLAVLDCAMIARATRPA